MATPLATFKANQRLAYESLQFTRARLFAGMTEIEAAQIIEKFFINREQPLFFIVPLLGLVIARHSKALNAPVFRVSNRPYPTPVSNFCPPKNF